MERAQLLTENVDKRRIKLLCPDNRKGNQAAMPFQVVYLTDLYGKTRDAHGFTDDDIHPTRYQGEPVGDRHETRAERVHGGRTCA